MTDQNEELNGHSRGMRTGSPFTFQPEWRLCLLPKAVTHLRFEVTESRQELPSRFGRHAARDLRARVLAKRGTAGWPLHPQPPPPRLRALLALSGRERRQCAVTDGLGQGAQAAGFLLRRALYELID